MKAAVLEDVGRLVLKQATPLSRSKVLGSEERTCTFFKSRPLTPPRGGSLCASRL